MNERKDVDLNRLFEGASQHWEEGQLPQARELFQRAAENGDPSSQLNLGVFCEAGYAGRKDLGRALYWYRKAARAGNVSANLNIADLYRKLGNRQRTLYWLNQAARFGDGEGELALARELLEGGSPSARNRAKELLSKAVGSRSITENGREEAASILSRLGLRQ